MADASWQVTPWIYIFKYYDIKGDFLKQIISVMNTIPSIPEKVQKFVI